MQISIIGNKRKDGKYKVRTVYKGAPNMFGGFYASNVYTSLMSVGDVTEILSSPSLESSTNTADFIAAEVQS